MGAPIPLSLDLFARPEGRGSLTVSPLVLGLKWKSLDLEASAGFGLKTESFTERGNYNSVGIQTFAYAVDDWRLGLLIGGRTNQILRLVAGARLPLPADNGSLE